MVFITKKQKKLIRARRRKFKLEGSSSRDTENKNEVTFSSTPAESPNLAAAPPPPAPVTVDVTSVNAAVSNSTEENIRQSKDIHIQVLKDGRSKVFQPVGVTARELKKFRKTARRQARAQGLDDTRLEFARKQKTSFPNLKELVREEREQKRREAAAPPKPALAPVELPAAITDRYRSLDCEMVGIGTGGKTSALARVSIVDWHGKILLDTFVKVPTRVTDFRTWVSGVRPKDLVNGMNVAECREKVAALLKNKILVGHALKNDFDALLLSHPKEDIRDTAKYRRYQRYGGEKWRPRKLRDLVKENIGREIQAEGESHDSVDDAVAVMDLFKLAREEWETEIERKKSKKRRR